MTWTVKNFLGGKALYDQVATVYGPFYYLYEWCALSMAGRPAAADTLRFVSILFWVAAALLVFILVYRATGSLLLSVAVHFLAFRAMAFIGEEPAHPQEACVFLLLALGRAFFVANRTLRMIMLGVLGAAVATSKINLGIFVLVALTVGITFAQHSGWRRSLACVCVSLAALALPAVLIWDRRAEPWAVSYAILVVLSLAAVLFTVRHLRWTTDLGPRDAALGAGAFVVTAAAICSFPLLHGSTLHSLFEWLIVIPRREYSHAWALPAHIHSIALVWAGLGLFTAWFTGTRRVPDGWLALLKLAFGVSILCLCATDRYGALLNFATPFLWLVATRTLAFNPDGSRNPSDPLAFLALLGVFQALYAYPVAGSQVPLLTVLMIVIGSICAWDGAAWIHHRLIEVRSHDFSPRLFSVARASIAILLVGVNVAYAWDAHRNYLAFTPLDFLGARHVRVEPEKAAALQAIVSRINASCGTLITEPGLFSFHLWTGKPSPHGIDHQVWMSLLDDASQSAVVREIAGDSHACVVYQQEVVDLWTRGTSVAAKPVVRFIRENFHTVYESNGYRLMMRNLE